ncbi:MAG: hypothetical protein V2I32_04965 [Desulforhopalus sp.]|nr:hypothetical protein [Desulforhopalus sp.]
MIFVSWAMILSGCAGQEYVYEDGRDRKEGPGLFSGEDGVFTVYRRDQSAPAGDSLSEEPKTEAAGQEAKPLARQPGS